MRITVRDVPRKDTGGERRLDSALETGLILHFLLRLIMRNNGEKEALNQGITLHFSQKMDIPALPVDSHLSDSFDRF